LISVAIVEYVFRRFEFHVGGSFGANHQAPHDRSGPGSSLEEQGIAMQFLFFAPLSQPRLELGLLQVTPDRPTADADGLCGFFLGGMVGQRVQGLFLSPGFRSRCRLAGMVLGDFSHIVVLLSAFALRDVRPSAITRSAR